MHCHMTLRESLRLIKRIFAFNQTNVIITAHANFIDMRWSDEDRKQRYKNQGEKNIPENTSLWVWHEKILFIFSNYRRTMPWCHQRCAALVYYVPIFRMHLWSTIFRIPNLEYFYTDYKKCHCSLSISNVRIRYLL